MLNWNCIIRIYCLLWLIAWSADILNYSRFCRSNRIFNINGLANRASYHRKTPLSQVRRIVGIPSILESCFIGNYTTSTLLYNHHYTHYSYFELYVFVFIVDSRVLSTTGANTHLLFWPNRSSDKQYYDVLLQAYSCTTIRLLEVSFNKFDV